MNTIRFNEVEFGLESYNKSTTFYNNEINSNANCTITDNIDGLMNVAMEEITSVTILSNNAVIYRLTNAHAHVDNINEYLTDNRVVINVNLTFTFSEDSAKNENENENNIEGESNEETMPE